MGSMYVSWSVQSSKPALGIWAVVDTAAARKAAGSNSSLSRSIRVKVQPALAQPDDAVTMLRTCADSFAGIEDQEQLYMGNLLDSAKNLWTLGRTQRMAVGLGESHTQVDRAMGMLLPALLAAMAERSGDEQAMAAVQELMKTEAGSLDEIAQQLAAGGPAAAGSPTGKLTGLLFGGDEARLFKEVEAFSGLKPGHVTPMATMAAALVLRALSTHVKAEAGPKELASRLAKVGGGLSALLPYEVVQVLYGKREAA